MATSSQNLKTKSQETGSENSDYSTQFTEPFPRAKSTTVQNKKVFSDISSLIIKGQTEKGAPEWCSRLSI